MLANIAAPTASMWTQALIIQPGAIDAGVFFANSAVAHFAIGAVASTGGYLLGKLGCAGYDAAKSGFGWMGRKIWG